MSTLITFKAGDKTPITKNFTRNEFQCSCGCSAQMVDEMLVQKLQTIRTVYDVRPYGQTQPRCFCDSGKSNTFGGVGVYWHGTAAFVHVDVRKLKQLGFALKRACTTTLPTTLSSCPPSGAAVPHRPKKSAIKMLQRLLGLPVDGIFGKNTENAVRAAQKAHNLAVDGIVGKNTWCAIAGVE